LEKSDSEDVGGVHTDFLTSGVMLATLNASGTQPLNSDLLKRLVRNRAMTKTTASRCVVGSGWSAQLLSGNVQTAARVYCK